MVEVAAPELADYYLLVLRLLLEQHTRLQLALAASGLV
jgi:hypothetical protein